ncbi:GntR family transcriptional regulator [bacterium]|nr:GntR family transcriptional regulator [bacterium]
MVTSSTLNYQPLYKQIKSLILQRVIDGIWAPGSALPSEQQLAKEFGVSQGTIRKALDEMTAENIFVRKQGKGTYVSQHSANRSLFHFFYIVSNDGKRVMPDSRVISVIRSTANKGEIERLDLKQGEKVVRLKRIRLLNKKPVIVEHISLAVKMFSDFGKKEDIPNTLYELYESQYDVRVMKAVEKLRAVKLKKEDAIHLELPEGTPVLEIDRTAISLDQRPVEWRLSYIDTQNYFYLSELT